MMTDWTKMAPVPGDQSERSRLLTIGWMGVCQTLYIEGSALRWSFWTYQLRLTQSIIEFCVTGWSRTLTSTAMCWTGFSHTSLTDSRSFASAGLPPYNGYADPVSRKAACWVRCCSPLTSHLLEVSSILKVSTTINMQMIHRSTLSWQTESQRTDCHSASAASSTGSGGGRKKKLEGLNFFEGAKTSTGFSCI